MIQIKSSLSTETLDNLDSCSSFYRRVKEKSLVVADIGFTIPGPLVEPWLILGH
jgi:hypothetical protein